LSNPIIPKTCNKILNALTFETQDISTIE